MIFVIGGSIAFFMQFLLLRKRTRSLADNILSGWMFLMGVHLFFFYFEYSGLQFEYPHLLGIKGPMPFLHWPFLLLYVAALTGSLKKWKSVQLLHFLPIPAYFFLFMDIFLLPGPEKLETVLRISSGEYQSWRFEVPEIYLGISTLIYGFLTIRLYLHHQNNLKEQLSYHSRDVTLDWLRNLIIGLVGIYSVVSIAEFIVTGMDGNIAIFTSLTLFIVYIGYYGIHQGEIFAVNSVSDDALAPPGNKGNESRYSKAGLSTEDIDQLQQRLIRVMAEKQPYLNDTLSLPQLAQELDAYPNHLSLVINDRFDQNFYDFVGSYRVEAFKKLAAAPDSQNLTILALALDSGFGSKSYFNKTFKRFTGQTPSQYMVNSTN